MNNTRTYPETDALDIPVEFIKETIKSIPFQPAVDLSSICQIIARRWAEKQGMEHHWLATMKCTCWEEWSRHSVYPRYHCAPVEKILSDMGYKYLAYDAVIYYYKGNVSKVNRWLNDDFRGTMENPY